MGDQAHRRGVDACCLRRRTLLLLQGGAALADDPAAPQPFQDLDSMSERPGLERRPRVVRLMVAQRPIAGRGELLRVDTGRNDFGDRRIAQLAAENCNYFASRQLSHAQNSFRKAPPCNQPRDPTHRGGLIKTHPYGWRDTKAVISSNSVASARRLLPQSNN